MRSSFWLLLLAYLAFISLGLPDGLLGVAWPSIRHTFGKPLDAMGILLVAGTAGYLISSFSSGKILSRFQVGTILTVSTFTTSACLLSYSVAQQWWMLVVAAVFLGLGAGTIDTVLNTYMARHYDARVLNWLHAFYGVGATLGPLIFTLAITLDQHWQVGYRTVGIILGLQAICFLSTLHWWNHAQNPSHLTEPEAARVPAASYRETLNNSGVWLGIGLFFLYTGLEVTAGQWSFSLLTEARAIPPEKAGFWVSAYWGSLTAGRFVFGYVARHFSINRLIRLSMLIVVAGAALYCLRNPAGISLSGLMLMGFFLAPIFPSLISATAQRLGERFATNAIGFQIAAATLGAACIPSLGGVLADRYGLETVSWYVLLLTILMLGIHEWQLRHARKQKKKPELV